MLFFGNSPGKKECKIHQIWTVMCMLMPQAGRTLSRHYLSCLWINSCIPFLSLSLSVRSFNLTLSLSLSNRFRRGFRNVFLCSCGPDEDDQINASTAGNMTDRGRRQRYSCSDATPYSTSTDQSATNLRVRGSNANSLSIETCLELSNASSSRKGSPRATPARNRSNTLMV